VTEKTDDAVGSRVAQARKLAGITQRELAARANVSIGFIRSVEQKRVPATAAFLGAVSRALRVGVADLTGQPFRPAPGHDTEMHAAISGLRTELAAYDIDNHAVSEVRPLEQLREEVARICVYRRNASFHRLGEELLPLMGELRGRCIEALVTSGSWRQLYCASCITQRTVSRTNWVIPTLLVPRSTA
jgi:transcriptional regulator with XRE-family HTH domain